MGADEEKDEDDGADEEKDKDEVVVVIGGEVVDVFRKTVIKLVSYGHKVRFCLYRVG